MAHSGLVFTFSFFFTRSIRRSKQGVSFCCCCFGGSEGDNSGSAGTLIFGDNGVVGALMISGSRASDGRDLRQYEHMPAGS
jgi:hypothetical protein